MDVRELVAKVGRLMDQRRFGEAEAVCREVLASESAPDGARILVLETLVRILRQDGRLAEAEKACRQEVALLEKMFGKGHAHVAPPLHNLSMLLGMQGRHEEAIPVSDEELAIVTASQPAESTAIADALVALAEHHYELSRFDVAELLVQRALDVYEKADGRQSLGVSTCLNNLGRIYENMGDNEMGVKFLRESAQIRQDLLGVHPDTAFSLLNYGTGLAALGRFGEAAEALARCQAIYRELGMEESPHAKACAENLGLCGRAQARA